MAKMQNWRTAPTVKNEIMPRIALYDTTLRVFEVPARLKPSAIRCLTESVTEVFPTASTYHIRSINGQPQMDIQPTKLNMFSAPTNAITIGSNSL